MTDIAGFFWAALAGGGLTTVLLLIAAVLGKSQLVHWLNKDIEFTKAKYQKELAEANSKYARDLELYRTSLISQIEATKAEYEVKKQFSLKVHEIKFNNLVTMHGACALISNELIFFITTPLDERDEEKQAKITKFLDDIHGSMMRLTMFLKNEEMNVISELNYFLNLEVDKFYKYSPENLRKIKSECRRYIAPVHEILTQHLTELMNVK